MDQPETTKSARRPARRRRRTLRATAVLPASFTLLNGLFGFAAIHFAMKLPIGVGSPEPQVLANLQLAAALLYAAMFCDMLDGRVARMTRTTSDFGAQLDSLCDVISFGVAPAVLMLRSCVFVLRGQELEILSVERLVWGIAAVYVLCAVLRLARFNVETDTAESAHMDFRGLPSPGAAAAIASLVLLLGHLARLGWAELHPKVTLMAMGIVLPAAGLITGLLMVSRFRYPHLVNHYIRGRRPFGYIVRIALVGVVIAVWPFPTMAALTIAYALSGPLRAAFLMLRRQRTPEAD